MPSDRKIDQLMQKGRDEIARRAGESKRRDEIRDKTLRHAHARERAEKHYGDERRAKE